MNVIVEYPELFTIVQSVWRPQSPAAGSCAGWSEHQSAAAVVVAERSEDDSHEHQSGLALCSDLTNICVFKSLSPDDD